MVEKKKLNQIAQDCVCFHLRKASRIVTNLYDKELGKNGLTSTQFVALLVLELQGETSHADLAEGLFMKKPTVSRMLALLESKSWVEQDNKPKSKEKLARITEAGREKLLHSMELWQKAQDEVEKELSQNKWQQIRRGLASLEKK